MVLGPYRSRYPARFAGCEAPDWNEPREDGLNCPASSRAVGRLPGQKCYPAWRKVTSPGPSTRTLKAVSPSFLQAGELTSCLGDGSLSGAALTKLTTPMSVPSLSFKAPVQASVHAKSTVSLRTIELTDHPCVCFFCRACVFLDTACSIAITFLCSFELRNVGLVRPLLLSMEA